MLLRERRVTEHRLPSALRPAVSGDHSRACRARRLDGLFNVALERTAAASVEATEEADLADPGLLLTVCYRVGTVDDSLRLGSVLMDGLRSRRSRHCLSLLHQLLHMPTATVDLSVRRLRADSIREESTPCASPTLAQTTSDVRHATIQSGELKLTASQFVTSMSAAQLLMHAHRRLCLTKVQARRAR